MESLVKIDLLEVKSPDHFIARVVLPEEKDAYDSAWQDWQEEMQVIEQKTVINHQIRINEVCSVKDSQDESWHRVRVEKIFYTAKGQRASCYYVDSGEHKDFPLARFFKLPERYQRLHPLVRTLKLGGLQPMSLQIEATDTGLRVPQRPTKKWDDAAINRFEYLTQGCDSASVRVLGQTEKGTLPVCLYLHKNGQLVNVNEILIEEEYACTTSAAAGSDSDSSGCGRHVRVTSPGKGGLEKLTSPSSDSDDVRTVSLLHRQPLAPEGAALSSRRASDGISSSTVAAGKDSSKEMLLEDRLKEVMAKVQRVSVKKNYCSDTEATLKNQRGETVGSRPPLGSQASSRTGHVVGPGGDGNVSQGVLASITPEGASKLMSPAGDGPVSVLETVLKGATSPAKLSRPSLLDSDSSADTESPDPSKTKTSYSAVPKFRCADSSPELVAELLGKSSSQALKQPVLGTPTSGALTPAPCLQTAPGLSAHNEGRAEGQVPTLGLGSSPLTPASLASTTLAAGLKGPAAVPAPSGAGRGRGLRKLYTDDIVPKAVNTTPASPILPATVQGTGAVAKCPSSDLQALKPQHDNTYPAASNANSGGAIPKRPSDDPKKSKPLQESTLQTVSQVNSGGAKSKCLSDGLQMSKLPQNNTSQGATSLRLNSTLEERRAYIKELHAKRQAQRHGSSDGSASDTGLPSSLISIGLEGSSSDLDVGRTGKRERVSFSGMLARLPKGVLKKDGALNAGTAAVNLEESQSTDAGSDTEKAPCQKESVASYSRKRLSGKATGQSLLELLGGQQGRSGEIHVDPEGSGDNGDYTVMDTVKVPRVWRQDRPPPDPLLGTIVCGSHPPMPMYDIDSVPFNDIVKNYILKEKFRVTRSIQANVWPAILRGRHVIGILPPNSGKTTSYLLPLVTELLKSTQYLKLPRGCGPKAIILVPSCKKADYIFEYVLSMMQTGDKRSLLRVLRIYGCEEHHVMPLLKGCDLLIATPNCLLRMLDKRYTFLDRLCHLVLDGVEVLVEKFTEQLRQVMKVYGEKLKQFQSLPVPRRIMAFGYNWTEGVAAFQKAYQVDPVIVFASRLEASVYGGVRQVVHMCYEKKHLSTLKEILDNLLSATEHRHIIITMENPAYLKLIDELMKSMSVHAQVIDHDAPHDTVDDLVNKWRDQSGCSPVLVVTDNNVGSLAVTTAELVIHFDLPESKTRFGNRLALMLDHFQDRCAEPELQAQRSGVVPVSHILVTEKMLKHVESLHEVLVRSSAVIPPAMVRLLDGMRQGKNEDANRTLCPQIKQFGKCADERKCDHRHLVLPCDFVTDTKQQSWPPATGTVKLRILQVLDTSHFYAMLLEHQAAGEAKRDLQSLHTSLTMDLAMYMANPKHQVPYSMEQGCRFLAAVKDDDGLFHRARVVTTLSSTLKSGSKNVQVFYVDEGQMVKVRLDQLLKLPQKLQDVPPLAVEVFACRIQPADGDTNWTKSSTNFAVSQLMGKDLYGTVVLRMQNTLWLDPLAQQTRLKSLKTNVVSMVYRSELIRRGMAEDNPQHIKDLYKLCEGKVDIPKKLYEKYLHLPPRQKLETETLEKDEDFHEVCISVVDNPHHFYVQKFANQKDLAMLVEELNTYMERVLKAKAEAVATGQTANTLMHSSTPDGTQEESPLTHSAQGGATPGIGEATHTDGGSAREATHSAGETPGEGEADAASRGANSSQLNGVEKQRPHVNFEQGSVCAARFEDGSWYRGQIVERMDDGWKVFFVDYGEREVVSESNIHHLPDRFCRFPAQAIECCLAYVQPAGEEWSAGSGDTMCDLAHYVNDDKKTLLAKEVGTQESTFAGAVKHVIELFDTTSSSSRDIRFSHELVWLQEAKAEDEVIKDLFPRVTFNSRKMYKDLDEKISDQCAALYWAEGEKAKQLSKLIADGILVDLVITKEEHPALQSVVKLIGYLRSCDAQATLLSAIVKCAKTNPEVCAAVIGENLMLQLVSCLEQTRKPAVQVQAAATAAELAKVDGFTPCLDRQEMISVMGDILKTDAPTAEILQHVCSFLSSVLMQGRVCAEVVKMTGMSQTVLDLVVETNDPDTKECLLSLLAAMASWESLHPDLLRERAVQHILGTMREAPSQLCVFHCARICQSLCRASRRNKRILLEGELVLIIRDLLDAGLQSPARELCEELNASLAVTVPQQQVLSGVHVDVGSATSSAGGLQAPLVKWSQNTFRVLLTVSVPGAREDDFVINHNQVYFRCELGGVRYGFDYTLFGELEPEKCRVNIQQQEVVLSLAKQDKGMWSRLLKEKSKFTNVTPDFERLVDSSDSEVEDPDNITELAREKVVRLPKMEEKEWEGETYEFSCTDDSESDDDLGLDRYTDDERFEDPTELFDPNTVLDQLIYMNAAGQERQANIVELNASGSEK